jgi:thiol:disulfide interchange protein
VPGAIPNPIQLVHKSKQQFHPSVFFAFSFIQTKTNTIINMPVQHIKNLSEFKTLLESKGLVVVDFSAEWCTSCRVAVVVGSRLLRSLVKIHS